MLAALAPQDFTVSPHKVALVALVEPRDDVADSIRAAVAVTSEVDFDSALEQLFELEEAPMVPIDMNRVLAAFGESGSAGVFVMALGEFEDLRGRGLMPYPEARSFQELVQRLKADVFGGKCSLEYCRALVEFVSTTLGLSALLVAIHKGQKPSAYFTRRLAERLLESTRDAKTVLLRSHGAAEAAASATNEAVTRWAREGARGVFRPFGDHVE